MSNPCSLDYIPKHGLHLSLAPSFLLLLWTHLLETANELFISTLGLVEILRFIKLPLSQSHPSLCLGPSGAMNPHKQQTHYHLFHPQLFVLQLSSKENILNFVGSSYQSKHSESHIFLYYTYHGFNFIPWGGYELISSLTYIVKLPVGEFFAPSSTSLKHIT